MRSSGEFSYSRKPADDRAVHDYWRDDTSEIHDPEQLDVDGVKLGRESIERRDEKLRRVLGASSLLAPRAIMRILTFDINM